jgi:transcriptional regulator with XRE-family HTH domain
MSIGNNIGFPMFEVKRNSDTELDQTSDMSIGERVRIARKEAGLTQAELSVKAGIKQPTLSELERGDSRSSTSLPSIAAALGVNAFWLETGRGSKKPGVDLPSGDSSFAQEVSELIAIYGQLDLAWRRKVIHLARMGLPPPEKKEEKA